MNRPGVRDSRCWQHPRVDLPPLGHQTGAAVLQRFVLRSYLSKRLSSTEETPVPTKHPCVAISASRPESFESVKETPENLNLEP